MDIQMVSSHYVANLLNTWYLYMLSQDIDKAIEIKTEIEQHLDKMDENQTLLLYYSLLEFRHRSLLKIFADPESLLRKGEPFQEDVNDLITYYFHFFNGMYEYSRHRYNEALESYRLAEKCLESITDEIEVAEFHYKVASAYYFIKETLISIHHTKQALAIYETHDDYLKRIADCYMMLGVNNIDGRHFDEAQTTLQKALDIAIRISDLQLQTRIHHNLALLFSKQNQPENAIRFLKTVLQNADYDHSLKALFLLTSETFKLNQMEEAKNLLGNGAKLATVKASEEYIVKFRILESLYVQTNNHVDLIFNEGVTYFREANQWLNLDYYATLFARFYREKRNYERATEYYETATEARMKLLEASITIKENSDKRTSL